MEPSSFVLDADGSNKREILARSVTRKWARAWEQSEWCGRGTRAQTVSGVAGR